MLYTRSTKEYYRNTSTLHISTLRLLSLRMGARGNEIFNFWFTNASCAKDLVKIYPVVLGEDVNGRCTMYGRRRAMTETNSLQ